MTSSPQPSKTPIQRGDRGRVTPSEARRYRETVARWGPFTDNPIDRLEHVLNAFADAHDDRRILTASSGVRHDGDWTGLTLGDLRGLHDVLSDLGYDFNRARG